MTRAAPSWTFRALAIAAALLAGVPGAASGQARGVLHITVTLANAAGAVMPVPNHALLISDNPATSTPRRVVTGSDGTADVRLPPGNYTVESDEPFTFNGKGYQWTQTLDVRARDVVLALNAANVQIVAASATAASASSTSGTPEENDPYLLLPQWQDSVVEVWTPEARASGFVIDAAGLVVTNQRAIGGASAVDVQLTPAVKVAARILVADRERDVAVLWIDPASAAVRPVPLDCDGARPPVAEGQKVVAIGAPLRGQKDLSVGDLIHVEPRSGVADFRLERASLGGPVFSTAGRVIGISSAVEGDRQSRDARVVPVADVCEAVASAREAMKTAPRPAATRLPVDPLRAFPADALDAAVQRRVGSLNPYEMSSSGFDVAFLTPVLVRGAQRNTQQDFGDWSEYFADAPPVLVVRVTPKQVESFWTKVARGAAYTQGAALPPITHFTPGFLRLQAFCGDAEVLPIHPFILDQRVSETDAVREGLYVFDAQALGPHCGSVKLVLYSEKAPGKPDARPVDPKVIERIWDDFAPYRARP